ncbi:FabD/lysophospholipase-like protein, partial [Polyplosphaeria fusca]
MMPDSDLRLLALDGGGVRGLSALMILKQLMETVNPDAPPKPCDYFDMIGGTSTGGLIAVMLGRLKMSIDECIDAYLALSERVFQKKRHRVTVKGKVQGRFDSSELAQAIQEVIKQQGLQEGTLLKDAPEAGCKVFVCATSKETSDTVCLTSYRCPRGNSDLYNSATIWEACRATSAASSFFDPVAIGRYKENFVDGATGANNPVREVWDQAQLLWGSGPLEGKLKCLVSIGTGLPSLKPFKDDVFNIGQTLIAIATETEQTAERFRRERSQLASTGRYYRFNVTRGLEDIGLEEAKKVKEIAAATRRYIGTEDVYRQMQACADNIAARKYFGKYRTIFSLDGVPRVARFVDRPVEMAKLEGVLLPQLRQSERQKIYILHGLGGIGKTQLAVDFLRRHHRQFSSVFWLDGRGEDTLKRSIAGHASKISQGQISEASRGYAADSSTDVETVVREVMDWLAQPDNTSWLLVFDNVDREYNTQDTDPEAYDIRRYLSGADHGSVLVTTRLARLEQLGTSQQLGKVNKDQAQAIFDCWYDHLEDEAENDRLLMLLDGLPLAIAQAGAYLRQSRVGLRAYLGFYKQQWSELMESDPIPGNPLQDYANGSVWTTWAISYEAIRNKDQNIAHLLLLWSFLDNKGLWYGLFETACQASKKTARMLSEWLGDIIGSEIKFTRAITVLRDYSLIEDVEEAGSYATHPVVHQWAYHYQGKHMESKLSRLAVLTVGWSVPSNTAEDYTILQRRLLPHAQACSAWVAMAQAVQGLAGRGPYGIEMSKDDEEQVVLDSIHLLGFLYVDQGKLVEAEKMYQ